MARAKQNKGKAHMMAAATSFGVSNLDASPGIANPALNDELVTVLMDMSGGNLYPIVASYQSKRLCKLMNYRDIKSYQFSRDGFIGEAFIERPPIF